MAAGDRSCVAAAATRQRGATGAATPRKTALQGQTIACFKEKRGSGEDGWAREQRGEEEGGGGASWSA